MTVSFTGTAAWDTVGTFASYLGYKEVTVTVGTDDLIVVIGGSANVAEGSGTAAISTTSGSTSSWTVNGSNNGYGYCGYTAGWATATGSGSVVVRCSVPCGDNTVPMGVGVWVISSGSFTGSPAYTALPGGDADGQVSVTVAQTTSTVLYGAFDWTGTSPTPTGSTPAGGTIDTSGLVAGQYAHLCNHWTGESAGSRLYGQTGGGGTNWIGAIYVVQEVTGSNSGPNAGGAASDLGGGSGTWTNVSNATGAANASYATWTAP